MLLSPTPEWVASLPNAKLPDRSDFKHYGDDLAARAALWRRAVAQSAQLRDGFADRVDGRLNIDVQPLR